MAQGSLSFGSLPSGNSLISIIQREIQKAEEAEYSPIVILTTRDSCNLQCGYCFLKKDKKRHITPEILHKSIEEFTRFFARREKTSIEFLFHGPEITQDVRLLDKAFRYEQELYPKLGISRPLFSRECSPGEYPLIRNTIQTNATIVKKELFATLQKGDVTHISISLDGPSSIHDAYRVYPNGGGSFDRVMKSVQQFRENNISTGAVAVFTKVSVGHVKEIYDFFKDQGISFKLNPVVGSSTDLKGSYVTPKEYANAILELTELYLSDTQQKIRVVTIDEYIQAVYQGHLHFRVSSSEDNFLYLPRNSDVFSVTCGGYMFSLDPEGNVFPCERFMDSTEFKYGNISEGLPQILHSQSRQQFLRRVYALPRECRECDVHGLCFGGCPSAAFDCNKDIAQKDPFCDAYKEIFHYFQQKLNF